RRDGCNSGKAVDLRKQSGARRIRYPHEVDLVQSEGPDIHPRAPARTVVRRDDLAECEAGRIERWIHRTREVAQHAPRLALERIGDVEIAEAGEDAVGLDAVDQRPHHAVRAHFDHTTLA